MKYFTILWILIFFCSCQPTEKELQNGESIAKQNCGTCHGFPKAELLSKKIWEESVLPMMAVFMGVSKEIARSKTLNQNDLKFRSKTQLISEEDWDALKKYYLNKSPEKLAFKPQEKLDINTDFTVEQVKLPAKQMPNITHLKINPKEKYLLACDEVNQKIWQIGADGEIKNAFNSVQTITDIKLTQNKTTQFLLTYIGNSVAPTLQKRGKTEILSLNRNAIILQENLYRPTESTLIDLNKDGNEELIINEYGLMEGKLSFWSNQKQTILMDSPGAIQTQIIDFDSDNDLDIITLFAQSNERIIAFINQGNLNFKAEELLKFPPVYGSSSFEIIDFNQDKKLDIVYTCGDNADYSMIQKPYHGLYIFEQNEKLKFTQKYFYGINGAYKFKISDFDQDQDLDIATIAFYATYNQKNQQDFIYFQNQNKELKPQTLNIEHLGRWLTIDSGDIDQDGDIDIALGSHPLGTFPGGLRSEWKDNSGVVILRNNLKK